MSLETLRADFDLFDDWEDRYRHVIELGKAMPELEEAFRVPATKVEGCASQVWLLPEIEGTGPGASAEALLAPTRSSSSPARARRSASRSLPAGSS